MAGNPLVPLTSATFDTAAPLFGTGALTGAYGNASTGPGGISGPTGLNAIGWSMEGAFKCATLPSATVALFGYNNQPTYSNAFFVGVTTSGFLTANIWAWNGSAFHVSIYTGTVSIANGAYRRIVFTATASVAYLLLDGAVVATITPQGGYSFATCIPPEVSLGNFYGTPNGPATGWEIDEFVVWPTAMYVAAYTPPSSAYVGTEGMTALWHLDSSLVDSSSVINTTFAPNNAGIVYSPGNWNITSGQATTICGGAYFRTQFVGTGATLNFNLSGLSGTTPQIWVDVDGVSTLYTVAGSIAIVIPGTYAAWPSHTLEVRVKATSGNVDRWTLASFVGLTSIVVAGTGASLVAPPVRPNSVWFIGDSATEGYNSISTAPTSAGSDDVDCKDSTLGWAYMQRSLLGVEVGIIGFGGQGLTVTGTGGVPVFSTTLGSYYSGAPRSFATLPTLIHLLIGANDAITSNLSQAVIQANVVTYINAVIALAPGIPIAVSNYYYVNNSGELPDSLNDRVTAALQGAVTQVARPLVTFQSLSGADTDATFISADGVHPLGVMNKNVIAPYKANLLSPILFPAGGGGGRSYIFS